MGVWKGTVAWGDYDNDGDLDLLITGETTNNIAVTKIYRIDNGVFTDSGHALPGLKNSFAAWGDFDNDGNLDLALSGNDSVNATIARIYRNNPNGNGIARDQEGLHLAIAGEAGRNYQIQVSSNLLNWSILTNVLQTNSITPSVDQDALRFDRRFYRMVAP